MQNAESIFQRALLNNTHAITAIYRSAAKVQTGGALTGPDLGRVFTFSSLGRQKNEKARLQLCAAEFSHCPGNENIPTSKESIQNVAKDSMSVIYY